MMENQEDSKRIYKKKEEITTEVMELIKFGSIDEETGKFKHDKCKDCNEPKLGHIDNECKGKKFTEKEVEDIIHELEDLYFWDRSVARIDKRLKAIKCEVCGITSENKSDKEDHIKKDHQSFLYLSGISMKTIFANLALALTTISYEKSEPRITQITKAKPPPTWAGEEFENFEQQVNAWNLINKVEDYEKFGDLIESLKKNPLTNKYVTEVIIEKTANTEKKTVVYVMELMSEKFGRNKLEKLNGVLNEILEFAANDEEENDEEYWDKFEKLMNVIKREQVKEHFNYMMCIMMLEKANKKSKISNDEIVRLRDILEKEKPNEKGEREPEKDSEVAEKLKN
jgi:hypothetical protein